MTWGQIITAWTAGNLAVVAALLIRRRIGGYFDRIDGQSQ